MGTTLSFWNPVESPLDKGRQAKCTENTQPTNNHKICSVSGYPPMLTAWNCMSRLPESFHGPVGIVSVRLQMPSAAYMFNKELIVS